MVTFFPLYFFCYIKFTLDFFLSIHFLFEEMYLQKKNKITNKQTKSRWKKYFLKEM